MGENGLCARDVCRAREGDVYITLSEFSSCVFVLWVLRRGDKPSVRRISFDSLKARAGDLHVNGSASSTSPYNNNNNVSGD